MKGMFYLVSLSLLFIAGSFTAAAQRPAGSLSGNVVDASGAAVAGATITVTDNATNRSQTVQTSSQGTFSVPQLEFGAYTVTVTAAGFKTYTATQLKIDVGREYSLNIVLEPGAVQESVTVVAGADVLNSTTAELSATVGQRQIQELPLNGRDPLQLIALQPGTSANGASNTTINGQQSSFTNITRDGINIQDNFIRENATDFVPDRPNVDDVSEFTITTQNAGAEKGYGSSQVELVTPRGAQDFHGALFIYNRNSKFAANEFFNNANGIPRAFLNRNQFGGRFSGPLPLPRFGEGGDAWYRNKAFFFGSYEGFRLRQSTTTTRTILLPSARQGIFTYVDEAGVTRQLDVLSAAGVTADPLIANRILANLPSAGNNPNAGDQLNTTGFSFSQAQNVDREKFTFRFDVEATSRQSYSLIINRGTETNLRPDIDNGGFNRIPFGFQSADRQSVIAAWSFNPSATFTNDLRGGWFFSLPIFDRTNQVSDFFFVLPALIDSPESTLERQGRDQHQYTINDNAAWARGNHSIRFGGQAQWFRLKPFGPPAFADSTIPTLTIGTGPATPSLLASQFPGGISATQLASANDLLGLLGGFVSNAEVTFNVTSPQSGFVQGASPIRRLHFENYSAYINDNWRVTPRLSLNFGLRYELFSPVREADRLALEPVIPQGTDPVAAILNPNGVYDFVGTNAGGKNFFRWDKNNFAPVFSFAWSPTFKNRLLGAAFPGEGRTVIRGGYRISYVNDEFIRGADNALSGNQGLTQGVALSNLDLRANLGSPAFETPPFEVPRSFALNNELAGNFGTVFGIDPNLKVPMTQEWNFGVQREVGFQTAIEIRYVGGKGDNLIRSLDFNQVNLFNNGFLADFERARRNLSNFGDPECTPATAAMTGCEVLTVFPQIELGGLLSNGTIRSLIASGQPGQLAFTYVSNFFLGSSELFLRNPNTGVADLLTNRAKYRYHALQAEVRRRFAQGLQFQANYTFQKTLTDTGGVGQTNFDPLLDINQPQLEYQRADYDQTHVFNFNGIWELPFGRGRRFLSSGGLSNQIFGGWELTSIVRIGSGAPFSILDPRGTLNRTGRSTRQTANSALSKDEIRDLVGIFRTPEGVFFINPAVINPATGRASEGFGSTPFNGQVFFNAPPGTTGTLERNFLNGPWFITWDAGLIKNFPITETVRFQIRAEAFNVLNRANFFIGNVSFTPAGTSFNINSTEFGRVNTTFDPRIVQFVGRFEF
jgi:Carboxypeptidase regulatory-like domain